MCAQLLTTSMLASVLLLLLFLFSYAARSTVFIWFCSVQLCCLPVLILFLDRDEFFYFVFDTYTRWQWQRQQQWMVVKFLVGSLFVLYTRNWCVQNRKCHQKRNRSTQSTEGLIFLIYWIYYRHIKLENKNNGTHLNCLNKSIFPYEHRIITGTHTEIVCARMRVDARSMYGYANSTRAYTLCHRMIWWVCLGPVFFSSISFASALDLTVVYKSNTIIYRTNARMYVRKIM